MTLQTLLAPTRSVPCAPRRADVSRPSDGDAEVRSGRRTISVGEKFAAEMFEHRRWSEYRPECDYVPELAQGSPVRRESVRRPTPARKSRYHEPDSLPAEEATEAANSLE